jgi:isopentenyl diphosphate isomerase/L-lactate dehydrogenase-like FMN-dependent dehydrogenase
LSKALAASAGASLTALHLDWCRRVDDVTLSLLPALVPALRHLTLAGCVRVTDAGIAALMCTADAADSSERCDEAGLRAPALTTISLSFCRQVVPQLGHVKA